ncbi:MAG: molybdenum cofactor guanylyltransferase [Desulfosarcinaceae bacterium]|jgi:molybdopterin-guanine dinucleotide biosynthesis protein A
MKARSREGAPSCSALLLAGGRSRRMPGINKAFAEINGRPMILHVLDTLKACFDAVAIVAKDRSLYQGLGVAVIEDRLPVQSPLAGIHAGLSVLAGDYLFCCACDTPLITAALIETLVNEIRPDTDVVVPRLGPYYQPLCAIYGRRCLPVAADLLAAGEVKVDRLYTKVVVNEVPEHRLRHVDPHLNAFLNVNTPADLETVAALMRRPHNTRS